MASYRMVTRSEPALAVVPFRGLHGVAEDDRGSEQHEGRNQRDDHQRCHGGGEAHHERDHEQRDGERQHEVADPVGEQRPVGDPGSSRADRVVGVVVPLGGPWIAVARVVGHTLAVMVRVEPRDDVAAGVVVATLDRPERRNALDHATLVELRALQERVGNDGTRVLVITGEPPAFCAGADLHGVEEHEFTRLLGEVLRGFGELPFPVLAAVDGAALGAGTQLAIACDLRVATPASRFGIPAARLGLVVDHWTVERLAREVGWPTARSMLLGAEVVDADRLAAVGAIHRRGDLADALAWAGELASLAPLTIAAHKLALERSAPDPAADPLVEEARRLAWASEDAIEGRRAFLEKRPAAFRGV